MNVWKSSVFASNPFKSNIFFGAGAVAVEEGGGDWVFVDEKRGHVDEEERILITAALAMLAAANDDE